MTTPAAAETQWVSIASTSSAMPLRLLAIAALAQSFALLAAFAAGYSIPPPRPFSPWFAALEVAAYGASAALLLGIGAADVRAVTLGALMATTAAAFSGALASSAGWSAWIVSTIRIDTFLPLLLFTFAGEFPTPVVRPAHKAWIGLGQRVSLAAGLVLFAAQPLREVLPPWAAILKRQDAAGAYWPTLMTLSSAAAILLVIRSREGSPDDRRRFSILGAAVATAVAPVVITMVLALWPAFRDVQSEVGARARQVVSVAAYLSLLVLPWAAAYVALVHRALDLRLAVRSTFRYALGRTSLTLLVIAPVAAAIATIIAQRHDTIAEVFSGGTVVSLLLLASLALLAYRYRQQALHQLDLRFFRQRVDEVRVVLEWPGVIARSATVRDAAMELEETLRRTLGASEAAVIRPGKAGRYTAVSGASVFDSWLARQAGAWATGAVPVRLSPAWRRGGPDGSTSRTGQPAYLVPLNSPRGLWGGVLLGTLRSERPYTADDIRFVESLAAVATRRFDDLDDQARGGEAARECPTCGRLFAPAIRACSCGGSLVSSLVPQLWQDRLAFQRRLGAGGGGAVYLAEDVVLRQPRAVKVIHSEGLNDPADAVREATLMAAVRDLHVATIHAVERRPDQIWLVCEFMDGGTLADRLTNGPLLEEAVMSIGLSIAGALGCLHAAGVVHGDVKPSNIGFDSSGTVKLFDFGLAQKAGAHNRLTAGTPAYLWPALLRGEPPGPQADAWGLGVTLYEAATGVNPFKAPAAEATLDRVRAGWVEQRPRAGEVPIAIHLSDWLAGADHRLETLVSHIRRSNP